MLEVILKYGKYKLLEVKVDEYKEEGAWDEKNIAKPKQFDNPCHTKQ